MRKAIIVALTFLIAACTISSEVVYLKNPETGETLKCGPYTMYGVGTGAISAALRELHYCIDNFKTQGYVRVPNP